MIRILLILTLIPIQIFAQVHEEKIETDSSIIKTKHFKNYNSIREFNELKDDSKTYYKDLYLDTRNIRTKGIYDNDGDCIGIWKYYSNKGNLEETLDFERGTWIANDTSLFKFYGYQKRLKNIADSIVIDNFGIDFFKKNLIFNLNYSAKYNETESGNWNDKFKNKPTRFLIRYDIKLNDNEYYKEMIEFSIDSLGNIVFPFGLKDDIKGFEKISTNDFQILNRNEAINKAKSHGLVETDSIKASGFLSWDFDSIEQVEKYNGHFIYTVLIKTQTIKDIKPKGRSRITDKYDTYNFNPWTKEFIDMKKMKIIYEYEEFSGYKTGLIPDE